MEMHTSTPVVREPVVNRHEQAARAHKVELIVQHLQQAGTSADEAAAMDARARSAVAAGASARVPSATTWQEVVDCLRSPSPPGGVKMGAYRSFASQKTIRGFAVGEVVSALQKAIRRSDEVGAVSWAAELDQSGFSAHVWNRLEVICSEDVGPAWPNGPAILAALRSSYERSAKRSRNGTERIFLAHAAMLLANAPKSRRVDAAIWAAYGYAEPMVPEIPDEALDFHTDRGRRMGRRSGTKAGDEHWDNEASKLVDPVTREEVDPVADLGPWYERYENANNATFFDQRVTPRAASSGTGARARPLVPEPGGDEDGGVLFSGEDDEGPVG
jgi:replication-associated recombination protein RarA